MKLNQSFHLCFVFCLGLVLSVQPMENCKEGMKHAVKKQEKAAQSVAVKNSELLHSELLFK
jgi:hypothetical protein